MDAKQFSEPYIGAQTILCTNCNTRHSVYPPGSEYVSIMLQPCPRVDYQKSFYNCIMCERRNIFYWHKRHREHRLVIGKT